MKFAYYLVVLISSSMLYGASTRETRLAERKEIERQMQELSCMSEGYDEMDTMAFVKHLKRYLVLAKRYKALTSEHYFIPSELARERRHTHPTTGADAPFVVISARRDEVDERNDFLKNYFGLKEEQQ